LHSGITSVKAAAHIDDKYAQLLTLAKQKGVEVIAYKASFSESDGAAIISINHATEVK